VRDYLKRRQRSKHNTTQQHNNTTTQQHNNTTTQQHNNTTPFLTRFTIRNLSIAHCDMNPPQMPVMFIASLFFSFTTGMTTANSSFPSGVTIAVTMMTSCDEIHV